MMSLMPQKDHSSNYRTTSQIRKKRPELAERVEAIFQSSVEEIFEKMGMKKT